MPRKKDLDINELKQLYEKLGSLAKVAKQMQVGTETVRVKLLEAKVKLRPKGRPPLEEGEKPSVAERVRQHRARKKKI